MSEIPSEMTAMAIDAFGGPDALTPHRVPVPSVEAGEVLVRVEAAGVGVWDGLEREGKLVYNAVRFPRTLGSEAAGTVAAVGAGVTRVKVGDRVYVQAFMNDKGGGLAEYVCVKETSVAQLPATIDITQAGGLTVIGATALRNLEAAGVTQGSTLLLWGASGGVGHVGLQLAKRLGAKVLAVASGADGVALATQLGADAAIDGRKDDVNARGKAFAPDGFDAAVVFAGGDGVQATLGLVRKGGVISFPNGILPEPVPPAGVELKKADGFGDPALWDRLNGLIERGPFRVVVFKTYPLSRASAAIEATKTHFGGKLVVTVAGPAGRG